jgi:hypothetical protein
MRTAKHVRGSNAASAPILFVNVGWMRSYAGRSANDPIVADNFGYFTIEGHLPSDAHEQWNFADTAGMVYGYVPRSSTIRIERLGAEPGADYVDGVLVVFMSRDPAESVLKVVGWYRNARVHRHEAYGHKRANLTVGASLRAKTTEAKVLPVADRRLVIPTARTSRGGVGQSPIWYAAEHPDVVESVRALVDGFAVVKRTKQELPRGGRAWQPDPEMRRKVEAASMNLAMRYFDKAEDVSRHARGWDIEAVDHLGKLLIEVKGLSGRMQAVELTPNEYKMMRKFCGRYVLFVVPHALTKRPRALVFRYSTSKSAWMTATGDSLALAEVIAARASVAG